MKYPMLCPWVELSSDKTGLHLTDTKRGLRFKTHPKYEGLLRGLDGRTPPHRLAPEIEEEACDGLLECLRKHRLSRQRPAFSRDGLSLYFTVPLARPRALGRDIAHIFNNVLLKMFLPSLILAILSLGTGAICLQDNGIWLGSIMGLAVGILLHELAHACACLAYGGKVTACGLMLWCLLPGAFVELDTDPVKHPLQRAQIFAAGVEMNLMLAAFFLLLAGCSPPLGSPCFCAAMSNGLLAILNLTLTFGLDGMHILSALLGVENLCSLAADILLDAQKRRKLRRMGFSGGAALAFCGMGLGMLAFFPLLLLVNLSEVLLWLS